MKIMTLRCNINLPCEYCLKESTERHLRYTDDRSLIFSSGSSTLFSIMEIEQILAKISNSHTDTRACAHIYKTINVNLFKDATIIKIK